MNYYYINANNEPNGPHTKEELLVLFKEGALSPISQVTQEGGDSWSDFKSLFPEVSSGLNIPVMPEAPSQRESSKGTHSKFCRNCGSGVAENAIACISCGLPPDTENKFCYSCGAQTNSQQVMCVKCGVSLTNIPKGKTANGAPRMQSGQGERQKLTAGLMAFFLGSFGGHKFYHGSFGWGITYILLGLVTAFMATFVFYIIAIFEGVNYIKMTDEEYDAKYNTDPPAPFKW